MNILYLFCAYVGGIITMLAIGFIVSELDNNQVNLKDGHD
jgi:hypothetical protein